MHVFGLAAQCSWSISLYQWYLCKCSSSLKPWRMCFTGQGWVMCPKLSRRNVLLTCRWSVREGFFVGPHQANIYSGAVTPQWQTVMCTFSTRRRLSWSVLNETATVVSKFNLTRKDSVLKTSLSSDAADPDHNSCTSAFGSNSLYERMNTVHQNRCSELLKHILA